MFDRLPVPSVVPLAKWNRVRFFYLFSAYLGYLGVLGDRHFQCWVGAGNQCADPALKMPIAEDAEVAEVRRERKKKG
jgi:hypothetical protein